MNTFTFDDLLSWSWWRLPDWQRDALRRVLAGSVSDADLAALAAMAKAAQDPSSLTSAPAPIVADKGHIRPSGAAMPPVSILRIQDIQNVNALSSGPVTFAPEGLTLVYGDNASGKSGLARILKKACRAREPGGPIRPHVFEPDTGQPATATIVYRVGDSAERSFAWVDGSPTDDELARVNVCDEDCAAEQLQGSNQLSYTPEVLLTFQRLAEVCRQVATRLRAEKTRLENARRPELWQLSLYSDTTAGLLVANLSKDTDLKKVAAVCDVTEPERNRRDALARALQDNPLRQAALLDGRFRRLGEVENLLAELEAELSESRREDFNDELSTARATSDAAAAARESFASGSPLPGLGTDAWRQLWESARRYSEGLAYPAEIFPVTHPDAICLLCQQPLRDDASQRLRAFERFVQDDVQQRADAANATLRRSVRTLEELCIPLSGRTLRELDLKGTPLGAAVKEFSVRARLRRRHLLRRVRRRNATGQPSSLPQKPDLTSEKTAVAAELARLRAAAETTGRRKMEKELAELDDRLKLAPLKSIIAAEVQRLADVALLTFAINDCDTSRITRKEGDVTKVVVTARLRSAFAQNLARLGFVGGPPVEVTLGHGDVGKHPYHLSLIARADVPPTDILSEGEKTCVALAGFLAELETTNNSSGIVFDDPVSSLDHRYRRHAARVLVEAATSRQVVVFTHDIVFLLMLTKYGRSAGVPIHELELRRGSKRHGLPQQGPPWVAMPVKRRLGVLRDELQAADAILRKADRPTYEQKAEWIYGRLRKSWERAVEEILLNEVVVRFGDGVATQRLKVLSDISDADIQTVDTEMTYCSSFAHDESGAVNAAIPDPPTVEADIKRLDDWVDAIKRRRKK